MSVLNRSIKSAASVQHGHSYYHAYIENKKSIEFDDLSLYKSVSSHIIGFGFNSTRGDSVNKTVKNAARKPKKQANPKKCVSQTSFVQKSPRI